MKISKIEIVGAHIVCIISVLGEAFQRGGSNISIGIFLAAVFVFNIFRAIVYGGES